MLTDTFAQRLTFKAVNPQEYVDPLSPFVQYLQDALSDLWTSLEAGDLTPDAWFAAMLDELSTSYTAAYMAGANTATLTAADLANVAYYVGNQARFLDNFKFEIQSASEFLKGWRARAESYAAGIAAPYWKGETRVLPLPAMPGDGTTQCHSNCKCTWEVEQLPGDNNFDAFWVLGRADHCQTCLERASLWKPLRIRGGRLDIPYVSPMTMVGKELRATLKHIVGQHNQNLHGNRGTSTSSDINAVPMLHTTNHADAILQNGFQFSSNSMYGTGVYFGTQKLPTYGSQTIAVKLKLHKQLFIERDIDVPKVLSDMGVRYDYPDMPQKMVAAGFGSMRFPIDDGKDYYTVVFDPGLIEIAGVTSSKELRKVLKHLVGQHDQHLHGLRGTPAQPKTVTVPEFSEYGESIRKVDNMLERGNYIISPDNTIYEVYPGHASAFDAIYKANSIHYRYGAMAEGSINHALNQLGFMRAYRFGSQLGLQAGKFDKGTFQRIQDLVPKMGLKELPLYIDTTDSSQGSIYATAEDLLGGHGFGKNWEGNWAIKERRALKHLVGQHDQHTHGNRGESFSRNGVQGTVVGMVRETRSATNPDGTRVRIVSLEDVVKIDHLDPSVTNQEGLIATAVRGPNRGTSIYCANPNTSHSAMVNELDPTDSIDNYVRFWMKNNRVNAGVASAGMYVSGAEERFKAMRNIDKAAAQLVSLGLPDKTPLHVLDATTYAPNMTADITLKHLAGQHNQRRHGWRYSGEGVTRTIAGMASDASLRDEMNTYAGRYNKRNQPKTPRVPNGAGSATDQWIDKTDGDSRTVIDSSGNQRTMGRAGNLDASLDAVDWLGNTSAMDYLARSGPAAEWKAKVAGDLAKETGIDEKICSDFIQEWSRSSNDHSYQALLTQKIISEEFGGAELSPWQKERLAAAEKDRANADAWIKQDATDPLRALVYAENTHGTMILKTPFEDKRGNMLHGSKYASNTEATRALVRAQYKHTQDELKKAGITELIVYRGSEVPTSAVSKLKPGDTGEFTSNALESWSLSWAVAKRFTEYSKDAGTTGLTVGMRIPASRIFSTPKTGFGCLEEMEFTVLNGPADIGRIISMQAYTTPVSHEVIY